MLNVDGNETIYPALPIGFGGNKRINFIENPEQDTVIRPLNCQHGTVVMEYMFSEITDHMGRNLSDSRLRVITKLHRKDTLSYIYSMGMVKMKQHG